MSLNLEIKTKLDELQAALLDSHPSMPMLLRDIHRTLKAQPDQVTLLTEQDIALLIQGLQKQTNTVLASSPKSSRAKSSKAALSKMTAADLGF